MPFGLIIVLVFILLAAIYLTDLPKHIQKRMGTVEEDPPVEIVVVEDVPVTDVPVTDVPVTDVPVTDVPVTDVPVTDVPVTDVPTERMAGLFGNRMTAFNLQRAGPQSSLLEHMKSTSGKPTVALFFAPWCGYCKKLMPVWGQFVGDSTTRCGNAIDTVMIDADKQPDLVAMHGVRGYPTIKFLPHGPSDLTGSVTYEGDRSLEDLVQWRGLMMRRLHGNMSGSSA